MALGDELKINISALPGEVERAIGVALIRLEGDIKRRIHNDGKASDGSLLDTPARRRLGRYSLQYGKKRQAAGRQTGRKDLQFFGDFLRSYGAGKSGDVQAIGFFQDKARLIAQGQQEQTGKDIFTPSDEEIDRLMEIIADELTI